jgi:hypothetical protein
MEQLAQQTPWKGNNPCLHQEALMHAVPNCHEVTDLGADMDQLIQILQDCHLHEEELTGAPPVAVANSGQHMEGSNQPPSVVGTWADELVRQLQGCASPVEARAICADALSAFHHQQASASCNSNSCPTAQRLQRLQGANGVIVKALKNVTAQHGRLQARCRQSEDENARLAEQLRICQEQLQASERANSMLQAHLQVMSSNSGEGLHSHHFRRE